MVWNVVEATHIFDATREGRGKRHAGKWIVTPYVSFLFTISLVICNAGFAQVIPYPGESQAKRPSILAGIGAGAERPVGVLPGSRIELRDARGVSDSNGDQGLRFLEWERWWHGRLYDVLASQRFGDAGPTLLNVDVLQKRRALSVLRARFEKGSPSERAAAAMALARLGNRGITSDLIFALEGAPKEVKPAIVLACGVSGRNEVRSLLRGLALDTRFGRRSLGAARRPVTDDIRCVALVALGMLAPSKSDDTLHRILANRESTPAEVYESACFALGLQCRIGVGQSQSDLRYGRQVVQWNPTKDHVAEYLALVDNEELNNTCRSLVLASLARAASKNRTVVNRLVTALSGMNESLARTAAVASADVDLSDKPQLRAALWARAKRSGDAATSGLALLALAHGADDARFQKIIGLEGLPVAVEPYRAFALVESAKNDVVRKRAATAKVKAIIESCKKRDGVGLAGCFVALGLLEDRASIASLESFGREHPVVTVRSAAGLALGMLGRFDPNVHEGFLNVRRANEFLMHDHALALSIAAQPDAATQLCRALEARRDPYSLGGIAQAFGLLKDGKSIEPLLGIIDSTQSPEIVRAYAIGAVGLVLEKNPGTWADRMRIFAAIPLTSPVLRRILSHL